MRGKGTRGAERALSPSSPIGAERIAETRKTSHIRKTTWFDRCALMMRSKTGFLFRPFWRRMREQESMSTNDRERGRGEEEGGRILDGGQGLFSSPLHVAHAPAKFSSRLSLTRKEIFVYSFGISRNRWSSAKQRKKVRRKYFVIFQIK